MFETRTVKVHPDDEQSKINEMTCFGWSMINRQEILSHDNYLSEENGKIYQHRKTTHFVSLVFQRDMNLPNIQKIRELQAKFDANSNEWYRIPRIGKVIRPALFVILSIVIAVVGSSIKQDAVRTIGMIMLGGTGIWFTISLIIFIVRSANKRKTMIRNSEHTRIRRECAEEAFKLLK